MQLWTFIDRTMTRATQWIDRHAGVIAGALASVFVYLLVLAARAKPFWHDEVFTAMLAQLPVARMWRATLDGVDLSPPLNTIVSHVVALIGGVTPITMRMPPIAGFLTAAMCLFVTVRRRTNGLTGLLAALVLTATPLWNYAVEARGYGIMAGCFALALYSWTEAAAGRRPALHRTLMAVALAAGIWTHYYAVLVFVPIGAAELVRQRTHTFQIAPWIAMACGALGALPLWPLVSVAAAQRGTFWAQVGDQSVLDGYRYVLKDLLTYPVATALLGALIAIEVSRRATHRSARHLAAHDIAAVVGCLLIPAGGLILGHLTHVFTMRYLVFATVAMGFALPIVIWWLTPVFGLGETIGAVTLAWPVAALAVRLTINPPVWVSPLAGHPVLAEWVKGDPPVVMTGGVDYLTIWYSIPEPYRFRAIYLADPEGQLAIEHTDTVERGYLALARWTPLPAMRADAFFHDRDHFWLYVFEADWLSPRLRSMHATIVKQFQEPNGEGTFYEVTLPPIER